MEDVTQEINNEAKEQGNGFLGMFLGKLGASLEGNTLPGKVVAAARRGRGGIRTGEGWGTIRAINAASYFD